MFDRYKDAFMSGHFQVPVTIEELTDGRFMATYTSPHGETVRSTHEDKAEANRRCVDQLRDGVLKGSITLGQ